MTTLLLIGAKSKLRPLESVPAELSRIKQLFNNSTSIHVEYEPYLTRFILGDLLRKLMNKVDIIHFAGHSSAEQLQTDDELVYSYHIAGILQTWDRKPSLLLLNGCNSSGQVKEFLEAGVSCVIATHNYIDDSEAANFAYEFYAYLISNQDKMTFSKAFQSAGSTVLMSKPRQPRSLDITTIDNTSKHEKWDWGLFSHTTENLQITLSLIQNKQYPYRENNNSESKKPSADLSKLGTNKLIDFFLKKKS